MANLGIAEPARGGASCRDASRARPRGRVDPVFWRGRRVLVTGQTGFKGTWLALWLQALGARLTGFSAGAPTRPSLYELTRAHTGMKTVAGDVRDHEALTAAVAAARPEVVIHMAAQSLVRRALAQPREAYEVNVMGTLNLLDAVRHAGDVRVVVNVTSDKCYENRGGAMLGRGLAAGIPRDAGAGGFDEEEPVGGEDPYSSSKACAELVTHAYRRSYFAGEENTRLASARAGNVIGGGDWGEDRLLPDLMRAALEDKPARLRNPDAVRPWQHVLNPLSGYLLLAQALWESPAYARAWNFGPAEPDARHVRWIAERVSELWPGGLRFERDGEPQPHEASYLKLDSSRARRQLGWQPPLDLDGALAATVDWYQELRTGADMRAVTVRQIQALADPR